MQLRRLNIELERWGDRKGKYTAKISLGDDKSEIILEVEQADADRLLRSAMGSILTAVDRSSAELRARLVASVNNQIEPSESEAITLVR